MQVQQIETPVAGLAKRIILAKRLDQSRKILASVHFDQDETTWELVRRIVFAIEENGKPRVPVESELDSINEFVVQLFHGRTMECLGEPEGLVAREQTRLNTNKRCSHEFRFSPASLRSMGESIGMIACLGRNRHLTSIISLYDDDGLIRMMVSFSYLHGERRRRPTADEYGHLLPYFFGCNGFRLAKKQYDGLISFCEVFSGE